jgi:hypothetical protein
MLRCGHAVRRAGPCPRTRARSPWGSATDLTPGTPGRPGSRSSRCAATRMRWTGSRTRGGCYLVIEEISQGRPGVYIWGEPVLRRDAEGAAIGQTRFGDPSVLACRVYPLAAAKNRLFVRPAGR